MVLEGLVDLGRLGVLADPRGVAAVTGAVTRGDSRTDTQVRMLDHDAEPRHATREGDIIQTRAEVGDGPRREQQVRIGAVRAERVRVYDPDTQVGGDGVAECAPGDGGNIAAAQAKGCGHGLSSSSEWTG